MPIREKFRRAFGRSGSQSDGSSLEKTTSRPPDSNNYAPGETMPVPKYRGRVDPKHKAGLEKFTFSLREWRRRSTASLYSPRGSRLPSRNNSVKPIPRSGVRDATYFGKVEESTDDPGDAANVGGSRNQSVDTPPQSETDASKDTPQHEEYADRGNNSSAEAWEHSSEEEITNALEKLRSRMVTKP